MPTNHYFKWCWMLLNRQQFPMSHFWKWHGRNQQRLINDKNKMIATHFLLWLLKPDFFCVQAQVKKRNKWKKGEKPQNIKIYQTLCAMSIAVKFMKNSSEIIKKNTAIWLNMTIWLCSFALLQRQWNLLRPFFEKKSGYAFHPLFYTRSEMKWMQNTDSFWKMIWKKKQPLNTENIQIEHKLYVSK